MVALRKDVKVGFVVGGIMLAVVGVYFALSLIAGHGTAKPGSETVALATNPPQSSSSSSNSDATKSTAPPSVPAARPDATVAKTDRPATPAAPAAASGGGGDDVWSNAFTTGDLRPTRSVTPDLPTRTSREPAAKPGDVIRAMNDPKSANEQKAANDPTAAPMEPTASAIDNTSGSMANSPMSTMTRTPAAAGANKTHVVAAGETLSAIAEAEYGSPNLYGIIEKANPAVDAGKLKIGQSLVIPPHDKSTAATSSSSSSTTGAKATSVDATKQYVVKPGDSLHKIASTLYGSSGEWQAIYDANKSQIGESPANLKVGMTLTLPKPPTKK